MTDLGERTVLWIRSVTDQDQDPASCAHWLNHVLGSVRAKGGAVELRVGMAVVASFDSIDIDAAVSCARELIDDARESQPAYAVHIGLALGEVSTDDATAPSHRSGAAWDRAQVLSHRARAQEVIFDEAAEQRGQECWLFAREVRAQRVRGYVLESVHWHKQLCRAALQHLRPTPVPHSSLPVLDELLSLQARSGQQRVLLRAHSEAAGYDCIERMLMHRSPSLLLVVGANAGCLRPLGSLAAALRRALPTDEALASAAPHPEQQACLQALMSGVAVQRADVVEALSMLLTEHAYDDDRPLLVFEQLPEVDPASLAVLAEVLMAKEMSALVLVTLTQDASAPAQIVSAHEIHELSIADLAIEERAALARAALSRSATDEVAVRVATLGGPDITGLAEALRTLVSSGDLIWEDGSFAWRTGPRQSAGIVPVDALLTERVLGLPEAAYRVLEIICCCPRHMGRELALALAAQDGLDADAFDSGLLPLLREGWVDQWLSMGSADANVRAVMRNLIPPARAAELHGFAAEIVRAHMPEPGFGSGEVAYHLFEAARLSEAARALVEAAHAAMETGFQRMALRLLATAVEWDPSTQIRKAARALARSVRPPRQPPLAASGDTAPVQPHSVTGESAADGDGSHTHEGKLGQSALNCALAALTRRDFDATERWLDAMLADGGSLAPALRVLALSHLMRGDPDSAALVLQRRQSREGPVATRARDMLAWGLVRLAQGDANQAIRLSLASLSLARRQPDSRGEAAALQVLSFAYHGLGREPDALQLEAAAAARLQDHASVRAAQRG